MIILMFIGFSMIMVGPVMVAKDSIGSRIALLFGFFFIFLAYKRVEIMKKQKARSDEKNSERDSVP